MSDIKFECEFCGGLSEDLSQDSRLPEQFRHGVYDVQEVLEDDIVQIHGWFHDGTNKFKVIYDPEGDLTIELGNGECLNLTQQKIVGLLQFFVSAEQASDDQG